MLVSVPLAGETKPTVSWRVPLSDVHAGDDAIAAVREALESGWWSMGPRVAAFEEAFAARVGVPHALATANCTASLHLALLAVGCGPGDEVVLPSLTFVAAANAIVHTGATPVFCDVVGDDDLNVDPDDLAAALSPATRAVVTLHYGGFPCAMDAVRALTAPRAIALVEDAAHAPGATLEGRAAGSLGDVACFSFFANKNLPIGEGGMLTTADDDLAERLRLLRSHGMTTLTWQRHQGHASAYDVVTHGLNLRMDEIRAAFALAQLGHLDEWNAERARLAGTYRSLLDGQAGITMPFRDVAAGSVSAHHLAVALLPDAADREAIRARLSEAGIQTSVHYPPIHRFTAFERFATRPLPRTDAVAGRMLTLPLYPTLGDNRATLVVEALLEAVDAVEARGAAA
jgi:dTDP-4-amino-4,6-dideoxygalactose transaminase